MDFHYNKMLTCIYIHIHAYLYYIGFAMGKAEEWGQPITEEALVRQGNEKCYQYRRKK